MEDQPLKQKQMSSKKDFLDDPPSATGSADMNHTHLWSSREDPQSLLVPENRRSINVGPLLKGTHLLKKYMLEEPNKVDTDTALILTATTTPDTLKPPSILKSIKPNVIKVQKSVTISEEIKEKSPLVDLDAKGNTAALNNNSKTKKGFIENFKAFIHKRKPVEKPLSKVIQPKDPSLEPQLEQYKFLNGNLNEWESEEEKLSRLRARHRGSLKGREFNIYKAAVQKVQTTGLLSSWPKTKKALVESIKRNRFVLAPDGRSRITWDMIGMLFILYEVITIPIQISFSVDDTTGFINIVEWLVDIFFISDILLTFNTGYYFRGSLVIDRQKIAKNYFVTWFFVDLLASIPFSRIIQASGSIEENGNTNRLSQSARIIRIVRLFKFIRVVRLIRVFKLQSIFGKLESFISTSPLLNAFAGFMRLGAIILFIAHWIACFWYLIADSESSNTQDTWVTIQQLQDAPWTSQYLASIYWAVTTMITVGYGDIYPMTNAERFYAVFTMLLTSVVFAYSMSSISALLRSLDSQNEEYKKTMVWVQRYMKQMNLDRETKLKVKKYLEYTMNEITFRKDDETRLLGLLSDTLKDEVVKKINKKVLENCEPLEMLLKKTFSERFITEMIYFFHEKIFSPREILFTVKDIFRLILNSKEENDVDCSLYMVTMGSVEIILFGCEEMVLQTLRKGNHFGEIEFFTGSKRQWGAKTTDEFASLFFLKRSDLIDLLDSFLNEKEKFNQMKDRICLYQDLSGLEEKCPLCKGLNHSPLQCPTVHYFVDKEKFLGEQIQETYKFRQSFVRRNRNKWHHKHPKKLESIASKIRKNLSSFIEAVENETRNHERPGDDTTSCGDLLTVRTAEIGSQYSPSRKSFMGYVESIAGEHLNNRGKASSKISRPKTPAKKQNKSATFEITFDAVYSFRDYFPHNNVENVIDKLNERLRKAKIMKTMRAIRRVIAFTSIRKKLGIKDTKPKARGHSTPSHDYGVGKIKFVSSDSKYMETLAEIVDPETGLSREASEEKNNNTKLEESAEIVADEKVRFNKIFNKESQEFNKIMKFKKLRDLSPQSPEISPMQINLLSLANLEEEENPKENSEIRETSNHVQPAQKIKENKVHTNCIMDKDYTFMSEPEINKLLSHVLDKYGAGYIQNIINKKHYGE